MDFFTTNFQQAKGNPPAAPPGAGLEGLEPRVVLAATPTILGTVFEDLNRDGVPNADEGLGGVTVELYRDNGDGLFQLSSDEQVKTTISDGVGLYRFEELNADLGYFVRRPQQLVSDLLLPTAISPLLRPGAPSLIIDQFQTRQVVMAEPGRPYDSSALSLLPQEVIGGERDLQVQLGPASGVGSIELRVNPFGLEELLEFNYSLSTLGTSTVTWDGADRNADQLSMGLVGRDLTEGGRNTGIVLRGGVDESGKGTQVHLRLYQGSAANFSETVVELPVTGGDAAGFLYIPFQDFLGPVSPSRVDAIQMEIVPFREGSDGKIDLIGGLGPKVFNISEVVTADLSVTKTNLKDAVAPGQALTYTLTVRNNGPNPAVGGARAG